MADLNESYHRDLEDRKYAARLAAVREPREVLLTREMASAITAAARECYERWKATPNRDAYVWVEMERAARAAVHAVAADLIGPVRD